MINQKIKLLENNREAEQENQAYLESLDNLNTGLRMTFELIQTKEDKAGPMTKAEIQRLVDNPEHYLTDRLTSKVKIEGMKLSPERILQLQDINLQPILSYFEKGKKALKMAALIKGRFELPEQAQTIIKERFTVYTENERELLIAEACLKITEAFDYLQSLTDARLNYLGLATATLGIINTYNGQRCLKPDSLKAIAIQFKNDKIKA